MKKKKKITTDEFSKCVGIHPQELTLFLCSSNEQSENVVTVIVIQIRKLWPPMIWDLGQCKLPNTLTTAGSY